VDRNTLIAELKRDEGVRLLAYDDGSRLALKPGRILMGHPTIGVGRALDVRGISAEESDSLLGHDIDAFTLGLTQAYPWFVVLDDVRQRVLLNMAFNLGLAGLSEFHDTLTYIADGRYDLAARAMEDSLWYRQVGARAKRLADMMRTGQTPPLTTIS
jgi:lysozyme